MSGDDDLAARLAEATTVGAAVRVLRRAFAAAGEGALAEARLLVGAVTGLDFTGLVVGADRAVSADERARLAVAAARRCGGEPIQRVIGRASFYGRSFRLSAETLVPRPDTEVLVSTVLERLEAVSAPVIADLGVGSGAILVSLLAERPTAIGVGADLSLDALATARANAGAHGVAERALFVAGSYASMLAAGRFDAIVSNPPYIASAEIADLDAEVRLHDPRLALDGGADGLDAYRAIATEAASALREGGFLALEIGHRQAREVVDLLAAAGWRAIEVVPDLAGRDRVVSALRPEMCGS